MADEGLGPIVREILEPARVAAWKNNPSLRLDYFVSFLGHRNAQLRTLAHLEVARAPYHEIKRVAGVLSAEEIRAFLEDVRMLEWHALYILLLAQTGEEIDQRLIEEKVRTAERLRSAHQLAAWATAWIEVDPAAATDFLIDRYLGNTKRDQNELQQVLMALSVHGSRGHTHLRDRIVEAYRSLLQHHPALATGMVTDLAAWKRWELAEAVGEIVDSPPATLDRAAILQLRAYLRQADEPGQSTAGGTPSAGADGGSVTTVLVLALILAPIALSLCSRMRRRSR